jgi:hypothetical protein
MFAEATRVVDESIHMAHHGAEIIGASPAFKEVVRQVEVVAPTDATVLLQGETGTGKELLARAVHQQSFRRDHPFITVTGAAMPSGLLESELFGHARGAFTGALAQTLGRFELAHQGTLLLDEIGDLPVDVQPKLLRVLQEHAFERLGSTRTRRVDVRLVAATNRELAPLVEAGQFRADLYYRLHVFPITVPPLRQRAADIPLLVRYFVRHTRGSWGGASTPSPPTPGRPSRTLTGRAPCGNSSTSSSGPSSCPQVRSCVWHGTSGRRAGRPQDRRPAPGPSKRSNASTSSGSCRTPRGCSAGHMAPRRTSASDARRCCIAWRSSASRGSRRDRRPPSLGNTPRHRHRAGCMGKTADLLRDRANLQGEIDRAALDRLPGRQWDASWVVCRSATVPPRRQETVPMARSSALTRLDVIQAVSEVAANEQETLAAMVHLLTSGQVRLSDEAISGIKALLVTTTVAA